MGYRVGLAVSGGADSTALLVLMSELRRTHGFEAVVLHFDHGLRRDSADDAEFTRRLAARFGLPFHSARVAVSRRKGESLEMAARRERLAFFAASMRRLRLDCIATGHHMDDVAETFIMRLKRSSGAEGLAGLKPVSFVNGIVFIRPLLNLRSADLRTYLKSRGISWREDSTNSDVSILRNKVRHVIIPFLERELDPKIVEHICRSASYLREPVRRPEPGVPDPVPADTRTPAAPKPRYTLKLRRSVGYGTEPAGIGRLPAHCNLDADTLRGRTIEVRAWRDGDWMKPCGFPHRKKLQDIFVTAKTPPAVRHTVPVIAYAGSHEVLWLPGYRISDSAKVASRTAPSIRLTLDSL